MLLLSRANSFVKSQRFSMVVIRLLLVLCSVTSHLRWTVAFLPSGDVLRSCRGTARSHRRYSRLEAMKRPILDRVARAVFELEQRRVDDSSVIDEQGRTGEPMEWSEPGSMANTFSEFMAGGIGYKFKQFVADLVAGEYDEQATKSKIEQFVQAHRVAMFSFTSCPFCRRAKDFLDESGIDYRAIELDELDGNEGNELRAMIGKLTQRTSVPCIFIDGKCIGGCNDGPGLLPLAKSGELEVLLGAKSNH